MGQHAMLASSSTLSSADSANLCPVSCPCCLQLLQLATSSAQTVVGKLRKMYVCHCYIDFILFQPTKNKVLVTQTNSLTSGFIQVCQCFVLFSTECINNKIFFTRGALSRKLWL